MGIKIGLESHVQLISKSKIFCSCKNPFALKEDPEPNTLTCPTCLGLPGAKPVANNYVIDSALKAALAFQSDVSDEMFFSRKGYFYPDQSKNFQITQYEAPLALNGKVELKMGSKSKLVRLRRLHLEEDPAKIIHIGGLSGKGVLIDYNRAGSPLIEIVTEPDFESPEEARVYIQKLESVLEYLGIYDPTAIGIIKTDANISMGGGERIEVKNITGSKDIEKALKYEIIRQKNLLKRGQKPERETRAWNPQLGVTQLLRTKEDEEEYGYITEPDLTKISFKKNQLDAIRKDLPELPDEKYNRFVKQFKLPGKVAESIVSEPDLAELFENVSKKTNPKLAGTWVSGYLKKTLNWHNLRFKDSGMNPEWIVSLLKMFQTGKLTDRGAEMTIRKMVEEKKPPEQIVKKHSLGKAKIDLDKVVKAIIEKNQQAVEDYKKGEDKALHFLIGLVMRETKGQADAVEIQKVLKKLVK
ncbi:MAG: Asp-tRNA(Asn)/Glu-tRNA(Gln) amidotransferase subunit GatB [Candidatus Aenigmarchaeota archaeon]|nr:Asp-tRNA(Asn)/Glu-tRNA(Gln) amidotransferase subunit GatB [Candidatus Aenigmarchaeota archaeon]